MKQKEQVEEAYQDAADAEGVVDDDAKIAEDEEGGKKIKQAGQGPKIFTAHMTNEY